MEHHDGLAPKGLANGNVGMFGAITMGISCVAPAYSLSASLGQIAATSALQTPLIILAGFIPMMLVAFGYRELNRAMPDAGTAFTWATRAFGPWVGWLTGWGLLACYVLVLSNMAGLAVDFLYLMLADVTGVPGIYDLAQNTVVNSATCFVLIAISAWISCRGMESGERFQIALVLFQCVMLVVFAGAAFWLAHVGRAFDPTPVTPAWFDPTRIHGIVGLTAGVSLSIFMFWGWDVILTMNEETENSHTTPGKAAALTILITVALYVLAAAGTLVYCGLGTGRYGLNNPDIQANVFLAISQPILGKAAILMSACIFASSFASLQSTMISPSRTLLSMGYYEALPACFARLSDKEKLPVVAILVSSAISWVFYVVVKGVSEHFIADTVSALGMIICFYYSITAFASAWYFRTQVFASASNFFFQALLPVLGGLSLTVIFVTTLLSILDPTYGSGSVWHGINVIFLISTGILLVGVLVMLACRVAKPAFFKGAVLAVAASDGQPDHGLDELPV